MGSITDFLKDFLQEPEAAQEMQKIASSEEEDVNPVKGQGKEGKETQDQAEKAGSDATSPANKAKANPEPQEDETPIKLDLDKTVKGKSEVMTPKDSPVSELEQKVARFNKLTVACTNILTDIAKETKVAPVIQKRASAKPADISPEDAILTGIMKQASADAQTFYKYNLMGRIQRLEDEDYLANSGINAETLRNAGGVSGLLERVAADVPEAVIPEELMAPEEGELDDLAGELEAMGVSPEEVAAAVQDFQALTDAGVTPDEIVQVVQEVLNESPDGEEVPVDGVEGGAMEEVAELDAEEVPADELGIPVEEEIEEDIDKMASAPSRREQIRKALLGIR